MHNISSVNAYYEKNSAISYPSYKIESLMLQNQRHLGVKKGIITSQNNNEFPTNLKYLDSFLNGKPGISALHFKTTLHEKLKVGF
ncbi:hypothetical protein [Staphylococcus hyicus]